VSDDGANLLVAAGNGVQLFASGNSRQISATRATALAFAPGTQDAVLAGTAVTLVKDGQQQTLADADSSQSAVGAALAGDKLYVANSKGVTAFDLPTGSQNAIPCACTATSLAVMGTVYRLNEAGDAPLWLLDPATGKIVFVPAKVSPGAAQ
jgi:glucose/arabinose dehydrogenase